MESVNCLGPIPSSTNTCSIVPCSFKKVNYHGLGFRRLLLWAFTLLLAGQRGLCKPFPAPDLTKCRDPPLHLEGGCCPPYTSDTEIVDFQFPTVYRMRTRKAAHLLDQSDIEKYMRAVQKMKELPKDDPRSFIHQAKIHCAYCNGAYVHDGKIFQIHDSWLFGPFHRWYMYFHERILADLIGDDTFTLPFWDWDSEVGMSIPPLYTRKDLPFYDDKRELSHQPPKIVNLKNPISHDSGALADNYAILYTKIVSGAATASEFHGGPYRYGDETSYSRCGTIECSLHNVVHMWTGSFKTPHYEDMGSFYAAGLDPVFYAHHCTIDRLWHIWNSKLGRNNYQDADLLDSEFLFYDENKQLVRVRAGDSYNITKLGYEYQELDLPWLITGRSIKKAAPVMTEPVMNCKKSQNLSRDVRDPVTVRVRRPIHKRTKLQKEDAEEVLCIEGIELDMGGASGFHIFINLPEANGDTPLANRNYAGTFVHIGNGNDKDGIKTSTTKKMSYNVGITETLEDIGAEEYESICVTLVPLPSELLSSIPVKFSSLRIEYHPRFPSEVILLRRINDTDLLSSRIS